MSNKGCRKYVSVNDYHLKVPRGTIWTSGGFVKIVDGYWQSRLLKYDQHSFRKILLQSKTNFGEFHLSQLNKF